MIESFPIPVTIAARHVKLGDTIELAFMTGPFRMAVARQVTDKEIVLFRSYIHTSDFSYTGGVICYHGYEDVVISRDSNTLLRLCERRELR
jgi:hypothetical protein